MNKSYKNTALNLVDKDQTANCSNGQHIYSPTKLTERNSFQGHIMERYSNIEMLWVRMLCFSPKA